MIHSLTIILFQFLLQMKVAMDKTLVKEREKGIR